MKDINDFLVEGKLVVPEDELDNIYIWTRVSKTQEALLSVEAYYKLVKHTFDEETSNVIKALKSNFPRLKDSSYQFADFITFSANYNKLFTDKCCFVYSTSSKLLDSLACYIAHSMSKYRPIEENIANLILKQIDESDRVSSYMETDFLILNAYGVLPEHKYKKIILDTLLTRRSKPGLCTLINVINPSVIIGDDLITKEQAAKYNMVNISALAEVFEQRRVSSYKSLMKIWIELMSLDLKNFVYSTRNLSSSISDRVRTISRYQ